mmetsp:Transcript_40180/g.89150  ORF Transcript_40180/g.89150 Transcript_40180/m.89150 type:complete len:224 (+) Transcript_40180:104-775(+)|eukprot:CAMPEP_0202889766 /NCGR_PEP_ID=MMETSP1392-20130828/340_1 /ASSEMBLY_ACC=CAM_ASM_000868 /TAXON_ID=225041 /ORGANISM="Chlamydomonas chlamydogama, Strain SAG 11-48b" /LENGTH=223 /DNA_ID=CAMNT_0049573169 /DNA_START=101 /DNA_END=772 /DNA_ORIENTATION=+
MANRCRITAGLLPALVVLGCLFACTQAQMSSLHQRKLQQRAGFTPFCMTVTNTTKWVQDNENLRNAVHVLDCHVKPINWLVNRTLGLTVNQGCTKQPVASAFPNAQAAADAIYQVMKKNWNAVDTHIKDKGNSDKLALSGTYVGAAGVTLGLVSGAKCANQTAQMLNCVSLCPALNPTTGKVQNYNCIYTKNAVVVIGVFLNRGNRDCFVLTAYPNSPRPNSG